MKTVTDASTNERPSGKGHGVQGLLKAIDSGLLAALDVSLAWHQRMADRHSLRAMDERLLKDIGLSQADVEHEATKPFWRP